MKKSYDIEKNLSSSLREKYQKVIRYDKSEIDNPDEYDLIRLSYMDRIGASISIVKRFFPDPKNVLVGDFACAQANVGLILAESGYKVYAIDINEPYLEYSKLKYEKGHIEWIQGNILDLDFPANKLDVAIAGELIEHCAYPEEIIKKILTWVRPKGILVLTTPNGPSRKEVLPSFSQILQEKQREIFLEKQFRPTEKDHLFLFKTDEIKYIVPKNAEIIKIGYCGYTILFNKYSEPLLRLLPLPFIKQIHSRILSKMPYIRDRIFWNIYAVLLKK